MTEDSHGCVIHAIALDIHMEKKSRHRSLNIKKKSWIHVKRSDRGSPLFQQYAR